MMDGTAAAINYERCDACGICVGKCPTNAVCMIIV
jgi:Pyruvate/2-oxoacid:ferredoxin oxidoreductase delta subunit